MPGSDGKKLADLFETNNPHNIAEGLRAITHRTAEEIDRKTTDYEFAGEEYPDKLKDLNQLFGMANKLHTVLVPKKGIQIGIAVGGGGVQTAIEKGAEPRAVASEVVKELVAENPGVEITDEMIEKRLLDYNIIEADPE